MNVSSASKYLGCSPVALTRRIKNGQIEARKLAHHNRWGFRYEISRQALDDYLRQGLLRRLKREPPTRKPITFDYTQQEVFEAIFGTLTEQEQSVLRMQWGLDGQGERTELECAIILREPPEIIRKVEAKALRKLMHPTRSRYLKTIMEDIREADIVHDTLWRHFLL